ncbi:hypothetical protein [Haloparvum sp. AD34]
MASITTLSSYLIVISLGLAILSNRPGPIVKRTTVIQRTPERILVSKTVARVLYVVAQGIRATGLLVGLIFAVALLFAEPNTGLPWFDSVAAAFVAIWTALTYSSSIESNYRRLTDWGRKVRKEALSKYNQEEPPLSSGYVAISELFVSLVVIVGGYNWLSTLITLPSFEELTGDQIMALLLIAFAASITYSAYKTGKHSSEIR